MFGFIKKLFRREADGRFDTFSLRERAIYKYFDGQKTVSADPLVLYQKMMDVGPTLSIDISVSQSPSKDAPAAHKRVVEKVRGIFNISPLDKGGLTEIETAELLNHFLGYCGSIGAQKKMIQTSQKGTSPSTESTSGGESPTQNISDSGSIESDTATESPASSQEALPSQSGASIQG